MELVRITTGIRLVRSLARKTPQHLEAIGVRQPEVQQHHRRLDVQVVEQVVERFLCIGGDLEAGLGVSRSAISVSAASSGLSSTSKRVVEFVIPSTCALATTIHNDASVDPGLFVWTPLFHSRRASVLARHRPPENYGRALSPSTSVSQVLASGPRVGRGSLRWSVRNDRGDAGQAAVTE